MSNVYTMKQEVSFISNQTVDKTQWANYGIKSALTNFTAQLARKFKKVQAEKLVKSNK